MPTSGVNCSQWATYIKSSGTGGQDATDMLRMSAVTNWRIKHWHCKTSVNESEACDPGGQPMKANKCGGHGSGQSDPNQPVLYDLLTNRRNNCLVALISARASWASIAMQ
jgi:hypothetical protein